MAQDMGHPKVDAELKKNIEDARTIGIEGTPGLVTARTIEQGARSLEQLQAMVDALKA